MPHLLSLLCDGECWMLVDGAEHMVVSASPEAEEWLGFRHPVRVGDAWPEVEHRWRGMVAGARRHGMIRSVGTGMAGRYGWCAWRLLDVDGRMVWFTWRPWDPRPALIERWPLAVDHAAVLAAATGMLTTDGVAARVPSQLVAEHVGVSRSTASRSIRALVWQGVLERPGHCLLAAPWLAKFCDSRRRHA